MKNNFMIPPFTKVIWVFIISIIMYIYLSNNPPITKIGYWITISTPLIGIIVSLIYLIMHLTKRIKY